MIFIFPISFLLSGCNVFKPVNSQKSFIDTKDEFIKIMFYNVENLFDTINNPATNDEDFLPEGNYRWNSFRYYDKLQKISKVIIAVGEWNAPALAGLCEIENREVMEDLIYKTPLKTFKYDIIHKESPDYRGIDVALLYRKNYFKPIYYNFFSVSKESDTNFRTRDILYAKGVIKTNDTLHIFVNHWPSRRGGSSQSEINRMLVANLLKQKIDSVIKTNPLAYIVIMGDFNDEPSDKSISEILRANGDSLKINEFLLYNLFHYSEKSGSGTYKYQHEWNQIDQIIVSNSFFKQNCKLCLNYNSGKIFKEDWLLIDDDKYPDKKPWRAYNGPAYNGGFSDHLPVYMEIIIKK